MDTSLYGCTSCGHQSQKWFGRCPACGAWSSAAQDEGDAPPLTVTSLATPHEATVRYETGISEIDRVLGGGLVRGAAVLLSGEPGIGKSTLVLQLIDSLLHLDRSTLLVTGEESLEQVALRGRRLGVDVSAVAAAAATSLPAIEAACRSHSPDVLVVDSIQTLTHPDAEGAAGGVTQVKACAAGLVGLAKETGVIVILIGHVTKDGSVAGPKALEHVVDVVMSLEGERTGTVRLLRASKNRFGSCEETGVFVMGQEGLSAVADPSHMLLEDRSVGAPGSVVFPGLEGSRPLLVELQALVTPPAFAQPRQVAIGLDPRRLSLLLGIVSERLKVPLLRDDVFVAAAGGISIREPAADLALCLALLSAKFNRPLDAGIVALGEVGLAGEVRRVPGIERRLAEAQRMGFTRALIPGGVTVPDGLDVRVASDLGVALAVVEEVSGVGSPRPENSRRATLGAVPAAENSSPPARQQRREASMYQ